MIALVRLSHMIILLLLLAISVSAHALQARVQVRDGVPTLLVNGEKMPPFILFHTAGAGATPQVCDVTPQWQQFSFTFRAPRDDDNVGLHINNVQPVGDWFVDDARFFKGTLTDPQSDNLLSGGDFEGDQLPGAWTYFLNNSTGASAQYSLDRSRPHSGDTCLRVHIEQAGTADYHIHIYQRVKIQAGQQYTFAVWLRASDERKITIKAVHQAPPWTVYGGDRSQSDRILSLGAERGLHIGTVPIAMPWARNGQPPDYSGPDAQVEHIISVDPGALIIPRINMDAPQWWKDAHPGHTQLYDGGPRPMASPASEPWRRDASANLRMFLRHLESKFGDHMLGYHIGAQSANEWFYDHTWERIMPCFEEPFRLAFSNWAADKYKTVDALRKAWHKPDITFETIRVPTLEERTAGQLGAFRSPIDQRFEIDFAEFMQVCLCEYLEECARIVKEETEGRKLGVFFYGYLYDVSGFAYGPAVSGHLRLHRALQSPNIDILCSPISYFDRASGGVGPFMAPVDSVQAHGKLWLNEDDTRTHLAPETAGFGRTQNMFQTLGVYRRNFGHQLERRCATWWMDFGTGWMADATIFDNFARTRDIWAAAPQATPFRPQVAFITDEDSLLYLRNSNEITRPSINQMRRMFNTMGCPVGLYLMQDVCDSLVPDSVRLYVFLNAYRVTDQQRSRLHRHLADSGSHALWLYAPGFINQDASADNIADLIGFEVMDVGDLTTSRVVPVEDLVGGTFGVEFAPRPLFAAVPGQPDVTVLGRYEGTDHIAMAARQMGDWHSIFCGGLKVSADVLREIARNAGAHIYCETNDVISACPGFISIHATAAGEKTLHLPRPQLLQDLYTGETLGPANTRRTFHMQAGETRLFARRQL